MQAYIQNARSFLSTPCIRLHVLLPRHGSNFNFTYFNLPPTARRFSKICVGPCLLFFRCVLHAPPITCLNWIFIETLLLLYIPFLSFTTYFYLRHIIQIGSRAYPASYTMVPRSLSSGLKRSERKADHSFPSSAEVKNSWSYTSISPCIFMSWCLIKHRINLYGVVEEFQKNVVMVLQYRI